MPSSATVQARQLLESDKMSPPIVASAPGKIILMGEHAAVYGAPALVAALDRRVSVEITSAASGVVLELDALEYKQRLEWTDVVGYCNRKRSEWYSFASDGPRGFDNVGGTDPGHVVKIGLGEVVRNVGVSADQLPPVRVRVTSDLPIGSGFGSSAAVAVAVVAAGLELLDGARGPDEIARLAMEVERRQHGHPSGIDHWTVLLGGIQAFDDRRKRRRLELGHWVRDCFAIFDTGSPAESTGQVVAAVRRLRDSAPTAFEEGLDRAGRNVARFAELLSAEKPDLESIVDVINDYNSWLGSLGVVPREVFRSTQRLNELQAAGKISGAGTLSGESGGCLLVFRAAHCAASVRRALSRYPSVQGSIGGDGLRVGEAA